jgi:hypothetical protein
MGRLLQSDYRLDNNRLTAEQIRSALTGDLDGFRYFFHYCCQLQDRDTRELIHPTLNKGQELIAGTILRNVAKETRAERHKEIVILGPRQFGKSTLITAICNYMAAYVPGMERMNLVHTLHVGGAAYKYCNQKVIPIVTGIHPDLMPTVERDNQGSSTQLKYHDIKGNRRDSTYEVLSAGSNSVRSGTVTVWLCDEPSEYRNPEMTEDAVSGAIADYGFSLTVYIGTFSDRLSSYFLKKIQTAIAHPEEMDLVFIPWFLVYGREEDGVGFTEEDLNDYDRDTIIPAMRQYGFTYHEMLYKIAWYHRRSLRTPKMRYEFPTTIDDIVSLASDERVYSKELLDKAKENQTDGMMAKIVSDIKGKKYEAVPTDESPLVLFQPPVYARKYRLAVDPISAVGDNTDYFAMSMFDLSNNEQVASFMARGMALEDYVEFAIAMCKIYNNAEICPEQNIAQTFYELAWARGYYYWYYTDNKMRATRQPGIRTTVGSKEGMISRTLTLLNSGSIILHDKRLFEQMETFVKITNRRNGTYKFEAARGKHDDLVATLFIYAGSLNQNQLAGKQEVRFGFL